MADVALVPERDVLERDDRVAADDAGKSAQTLARDRVSLVRHGRTAFLAFAEIFFHLENFGVLEVTKLGRPTIDARSDHGERAQKLGVTIALNNLGGQRGGFDPEAFANFSLNFWIEMRVRADGPADFADANSLASLAETFFGAAELIEHEREFETESDRLGVGRSEERRVGKECRSRW